MKYNDLQRDDEVTTPSAKQPTPCAQQSMTVPHGQHVDSEKKSTTDSYISNKSSGEYKSSNIRKVSFSFKKG